MHSKKPLLLVSALLLMLNTFSLLAQAILTEPGFHALSAIPGNAEGRCVLENQAGFLVAANLGSTTQGKGIFIQYDQNGQYLWHKALGDLFLNFYKMTATPDGGAVAVGAISGDFTADGVVIKINASGVIQWQKRIRTFTGTTYLMDVFAVGSDLIISGRQQETNSFNFNALVVRLNASGQTLWQRRYYHPEGAFLQCGWHHNGVLYMGGQVAQKGWLAILNFADGAALQQRVLDNGMQAQEINSLYRTQSGDFILNGGFRQNGISEGWIARMQPDGALLWSKRVPLPDNDPLKTHITPARSGGFYMALNDLNSSNDADGILARFSENGAVQWCRSYGNNEEVEGLMYVSGCNDNGFVAAGYTTTPTSGNNHQIFIVRADSVGQMAICCRFEQALNPTDMSATVTSADLTSNTDLFISNTVFFPYPLSNFQHITICPSTRPIQVFWLATCPNQPYAIGNQFFTSPDTVYQILGPSSCDSVLAYILLEKSSSSSNLAIQCPANLTVTLGVGQNSQPVPYPTAQANSNCVCDGLELEQMSGPASGTSLGTGDYSVCWMATDACGSSTTCCMNIQVLPAPEAPCDAAQTGCVSWDLFSPLRTAAGDLEYRIQVKNTCTDPLAFAYIGLPAGITPLTPANQSTYEAPSGRTYQVRQPNFSPVYGIRFRSSGPGIQQGESDMLRYTLPGQTLPEHIFVAARLASGAYYEGYLQTNFCPVVPAGTAERESNDPIPTEPVRIYPTLLDEAAWLTVEGLTVSPARLRLWDVAGRLLLDTEIQQGRAHLGDRTLPSGVYLAEIIQPGQAPLRQTLLK